MKPGIKKACWWLVGVAALAGIVLLFALMPDREPLVISVAGRTNDSFGERVLIVVSNRSNREFFIIAYPTALIGRRWEEVRDPRDILVAGWGVPGLPTEIVPARGNGTLNIPFPTNASRLKVVYRIWRQFGDEPVGTPVRGMLEIEL